MEPIKRHILLVICLIIATASMAQTATPAYFTDEEPDKCPDKPFALTYQNFKPVTAGFCPVLHICSQTDTHCPACAFIARIEVQKLSSIGICNHLTYAPKGTETRPDMPFLKAQSPMGP